ncbi:MAG: hypothetical protein AB7V25_16955, partial [Mangrovibacterium sp.]
MEKKLTGVIPRQRDLTQKIWFIMRLTVFLLLVLILPVSASVYSQQAKINLKLDNASLEEVFRAIREQSDFDFFYKTDQIPANKKVSVDYRNAQVEAV